MKIGRLDTEEKVVVVAEIGNNHEGSFERAGDLLAAAARAGADVVKFQTFIPELFVSRDSTERLALLRRFQLSFEQFAKLAVMARANGVEFLSTPLDLESLKFLAGFAPAIKIASGDNSFVELLRQAGALPQPVIVSAGLAEKQDMRDAVKLVRDSAMAHGVDKQIAALHCVSAYPTPMEEANVRAMADLRDIGADVVGYSDHTIGSLAAVLSVGLGARIVEKHFTLDNNFSDFRDHKLSLNPEDFARFVTDIRAAEAAMGSARKTVQASELANRTAVRRSAAAAADLALGHVVGAEDIMWVRPGSGIQYEQSRALVGRSLARPMKAGELFSMDAFV